MTWFKVSDDFHAHPKVAATDPAAIGLWTIAGSWSCANLTGGFVPDGVLQRLAPDATKLARKLVTAGLWLRSRGGYQFQDWDEYNPSRATGRALRNKRSKAARAGNHKRWHVDRSVTDPDCPLCNPKPP